MSIPVNSLLSQEETDFKKESMASSVHEVTANKNSSFLQPKAMKFGKKCVMEGVHVARNRLTCALCSSISGMAAGSDGSAVSLFKTGGVTGRGGAGLKRLYGCLFGRLLTIGLKNESGYAFWSTCSKYKSATVFDNIITLSRP